MAKQARSVSQNLYWAAYLGGVQTGRIVLLKAARQGATELKRSQDMLFYKHFECDAMAKGIHLKHV